MITKQHVTLQKLAAEKVSIGREKNRAQPAFSLIEESPGRLKTFSLMMEGKNTEAERVEPYTSAIHRVLTHLGCPEHPVFVPAPLVRISSGPSLRQASQRDEDDSAPLPLLPHPRLLSGKKLRRRLGSSCALAELADNKDAAHAHTEEQVHRACADLADCAPAQIERGRKKAAFQRMRKRRDNDVQKFQQYKRCTPTCIYSKYLGPPHLDLTGN